ncbi:MAG: TolC family protein [Clostridiales bacterium]|jgi:outer membrane protein TolC|nr:TolC family protein [Clostridiales bacterium]
MKRIVSAALMCLVMVTPVFGQAPAVLERLTVDQAVEAAIAASNDLKSYDDSLISNNESLDSLKEQFQLETDYGKVLSLAVQIMQMETQNTQTNNNANLAVDKLRISVMNLFASIINAQNALTLADQSLSIQKRQLDIAKIKYNLGYISKIDYDTQTNSYNQKLASRETQKIAIDNAFVSLNKLLGYTLTKQYDLVLDLHYTPLGEISIAGAVDTALRSDPSLVNQQGNVEVAQYKIDMYDSEVSTDTEESLDRNLQQAERSLYETQRGIEQKVVNAYNNIKNQEISYDNAILALEALNLQLPLKVKQAELGKITKLELDQLYYQIAQQQETIRSLSVSHAINVTQFNNPGTL